MRGYECLIGFVLGEKGDTSQIITSKKYELSSMTRALGTTIRVWSQTLGMWIHEMCTAACPFYLRHDT